MLYSGRLCQVTFPVSTKPSMDSLSLRLNLSTSDGDVSPFSDPVVITLELLDTTLKCPQKLCVIGCTATHARLRWVEPEGGVKPRSYQIYCNDTMVKTTTLLGWVRMRCYFYFHLYYFLQILMHIYLLLPSIEIPCIFYMYIMFYSDIHVSHYTLQLA